MDNKILEDKVMNRLKKFLKFVVSGILTVNLVSICPVRAEDVNQYGLGDAVVSANDEQAFFSQYGVSNDDNILEGADGAIQLPTSVDLSTSPYFPEIGDQGSLGSCVSWATTYYQFTYEAHKLNNIITTSENTYSPTWTFNLTNGGNNAASLYTDAYNVLINQGALTMDDMPYNMIDYDYSWSTDTDAMINALNTRVSSIGHVGILTSGATITNNQNSDLNMVKSLLNSGKVLMVRGAADFGLMNWSYKNRYGSSNEYVAYRAAYSMSGHAMTIVGYDDNVCCDVNGNGTIEECERGAFKMVNSYGTNWKNGGSVWVLYDALNKVSANTINNWEDRELGQRVPIFQRNDEFGNSFYFMNVENCEVGLVGLLSVNTSYRNKLSTSIFRSSNSIYNSSNSIDFFNDKYSKNDMCIDDNVEFNGILVQDYGDLDKPLSICSEGYYYGIKVNNKKSNVNAKINDISYKIVDNLSNTICDFNDLSTLSNGDSKTLSQKIQLQKGDVNFDGVLTTADVDYIMNYVLEVGELSNIQYYLADCSGDNKVNSVDIVVLRKMLTN